MTAIFSLLVAQSLGEYGGMGSALQQGWSSLQATVTNLIGNTGTGTWLLIGGGAVVLWLFLRGKR